MMVKCRYCVDETPARDRENWPCPRCKDRFPIERGCGWVDFHNQRECKDGFMRLCPICDDVGRIVEPKCVECGDLIDEDDVVVLSGHRYHYYCHVCAGIQVGGIQVSA